MTSLSNRLIHEHVTDLCRSILEKSDIEVASNASLTEDLGLDSLQIMQFFAGIEALYPEISLEEWFLVQGGTGKDTVQSVVDHIDRNTLRVAAE
ncbi:acyl carrier protein [Microvirga flavescens]|uniref:acyl carrier protein n=1 Tax=Microvirga flavescens TaxID=2249811 RepID=UPI000DDB7341|nr:acyl carrier protein [Microvirga flavescens]